MKDGDAFIEKVLKKLEAKKPSVEYVEYETSISAIAKKGLLQDIEQRKVYAKKSFRFMRHFTFSILFIIFLFALEIKNYRFSFYLSETVLIALITTSLGTVVGIFIFVMRYLFKG